MLRSVMTMDVNAFEDGEQSSRHDNLDLRYTNLLEFNQSRNYQQLRKNVLVVDD